MEVFDHSLNQRMPAVLGKDFVFFLGLTYFKGLSADNLVILDVPSGLVIFATPTHSILGWIQIADNG